MAAPGRTLTVYLTADTSRAAAQLGAFDTKLAALGAAARTAAIGGIAIAGAALGAFAISSVKAAQESEVADRRLRQVARSMGLVSGAYAGGTDRLNEYAASLSVAIGKDDEQISAVQAKLLTFRSLGETINETGGALDRATAAAFDLAATGFGTAETNAVQLGKALQDPVNGLTSLARAGVTFTDQEKARIATLVESNKLGQAQALVLAAIEEQVGGVGEATATATDRMAVAFDSVQEKVGGALLPAIEQLATYVTETLVPAFQSWWKDNGKQVAKNIQDITAQVISFMGQGGGFRKQLDDISVILGAVAGALRVAGAAWALVNDKAGDGNVIVKSAIGALRALLDPVGTAAGALVALKVAWDNVANAARNAWQAIQNAISAISDFWSKVPTGGLPIFGRSTPAGAGDTITRLTGYTSAVGAARSTAGGVFGYGPATGPAVVVNINTGVGDPVRIAREVERTLAARRYRVGVA